MEVTRLLGVPHVEVPALHTFIINRVAVATLALRFLEHKRRSEDLATTTTPR